jgi:hypothetical protein
VGFGFTSQGKVLGNKEVLVQDRPQALGLFPKQQTAGQLQQYEALFSW